MEILKVAFNNSAQEPSVIFKDNRFEVFFVGLTLPEPGSSLDSPDSPKTQNILSMSVARAILNDRLELQTIELVATSGYVNIPEVKFENGLYTIFSTGAGDGGGFHKNEFIEMRTSEGGLNWSKPSLLLKAEPSRQFTNWAVMMPAAVWEGNHWNLFYTAVQVDERKCDYTKRFGGRVSDIDDRCVYPTLGRVTLTPPQS